MDPSGLSIYQLGQVCHLSTSRDDLPSSMSIHAEDHPLPIAGNRAASLDVFPKHAQGVTIEWQYPLPMVLLLLSMSLLDLDPTRGAERMTSAKSLSAPGTGQLQISFEMLNGYSAMVEVHVFYLQTQGFTDPTAQVEKQANQQSIS